MTCFSCETLGDRKVPIYRVNIYPYNQTCSACGKVLVKGQTAAWLELFTAHVA